MRVGHIDRRPLRLVFRCLGQAGGQPLDIRVQMGQSFSASVEPNPLANQLRLSWPIWVTVGAFVLVGICLTPVATQKPSVISACFIAVLYCESSLLGLWTAFSNRHFVVRITILVVVTVLLITEMSWVLSPLRMQCVVLVAVPTLLIGAISWLFRLFKAQLVCNHQELVRPREGLQFSIRDLMWLTFVVASLLTLGKLVLPFSQGMGITLVFAAVGIGIAAVALSSAWAALGSGNPMLRSVVVAIVAGFAGGIIGGAVRFEMIYFWIPTLLLHALLLTGALLVVRRCGYRLTKRIGKVPGA